METDSLILYLPIILGDKLPEKIRRNMTESIKSEKFNTDVYKRQPTIYALHRARKYLDSVGAEIDLVITGGLRVSSDFAKAIAMGADAVAIASAALIASACQQYRICGSGQCPVGAATQDPELRQRLKVDRCV